MATAKLKFYLEKINKLGFLVPNPTARQTILGLSITIGYVSMTVALIMQYPYIDKNDIEELITNSEGLSPFVLISGYAIIGIINKKKFLNLIDLSSQFLTTENCSESTSMEVTNRLTLLDRFYLFFVRSTFITTITILISSIIARRNLVLGTWAMSASHLLYTTVYLLNGIMMFSMQYFLNFDLLFLRICVEIQMQFKILYDLISNMSVEDIDSHEALMKYYEDLKVHIRHHVFLLKYIKYFKQCYSPVFFTVFLTATPMIISEFYVLFESSNLEIKCRSLLIVISMTTHIAIFCIPLDNMVAESKSVADAIYESNWYSKHFKILKVPHELMIQMSQQEVRFLAGGLIEFNISTLKTIFRFAMSVTSILRNTRN